MQSGPPEPSRSGEPDSAEFSAVARSSRRAPAAVILGAIAVLAFAVLTKGSTPPDPRPQTSVQPPGSPAAVIASPTPTPKPEPTAVPSLGPPDRDPTVTPKPTFVAVAADPGAVLLVPGGDPAARVGLTLPPGWQRASDGLVVKGGGNGPRGMSIGVWSLRDVYLYPCRWSSRAFVDPSLMGTASSEAVALQSWWGQAPGAPPPSNLTIAPIASRRRSITISGLTGTYVEVLVLRGLDFHQCDGGQLILWDAADGSVRYGLGPAELNRLWVVDVAGGPIVIDAASFPGTSAADKAELQRMIGSIVIEQ